MQNIQDIAVVHGESFYLFHPHVFRRNYERYAVAFREVYQKTQVAYSYKTNYLPYACRLVEEMGGFAEVVSDMEYMLAKELRVDPAHIIFNGPVKTIDAVEDVLIHGGTVNLDAIYECALVEEISCRHRDKILSVGLRCNFDLDSKSPSRFGMDVGGSDFAVAITRLGALGNVRLAGLHCHFPMRDSLSYEKRAKKMLALSKKVFSVPPIFINIGGGFFGEVGAELRSQLGGVVATEREYAHVIGKAFAETFAAYPESSQPWLIIEPGTALVANTMQFASRVVSVKNIRGKSFTTVHGSIYNTCPTAKGINLPIAVYRPGIGRITRSSQAPTDICGYTCIESDVLYRGCDIEIEQGDFIVFDNVGSYSVVMKPPFILPNVPILEVNERGFVERVLKRREMYNDVFGTFQHGGSAFERET